MYKQINIQIDIHAYIHAYIPECILTVTPTDRKAYIYTYTLRHKYR